MEPKISPAPRGRSTSPARVQSPKRTRSLSPKPKQQPRFSSGQESNQESLSIVSRIPVANEPLKPQQGTGERPLLHDVQSAIEYQTLGLRHPSQVGFSSSTFTAESPIQGSEKTQTQEILGGMHPRVPVVQASPRNVSAKAQPLDPFDSGDGVKKPPTVPFSQPSSSGEGPSSSSLAQGLTGQSTGSGVEVVIPITTGPVKFPRSTGKQVEQWAEKSQQAAERSIEAAKRSEQAADRSQGAALLSVASAARSEKSAVTAQGHANSALESSQKAEDSSGRSEAGAVTAESHANSALESSQKAEAAVEKVEKTLDEHKKNLPALLEEGVNAKIASLSILSKVKQEVVSGFISLPVFDETHGLGRHSAKLNSPDFLEQYAVSASGEIVPRGSVRPESPDYDAFVDEDRQISQKEYKPNFSVEYTPSFRYLNQAVHFFRHRFGLSASFFVEFVGVRPYFGVRLTMNEDLAINKFSPVPGDGYGFSRPSKLTVLLFNRHEITRTTWKKNQENFSGYRYNFLFDLPTVKQSLEIRPAVGLGLLKKDKSESNDSTWTSLKTWKNGLFLESGVDINKRYAPFIFLKNKCRVMVGFPNQDMSETPSVSGLSKENEIEPKNIDTGLILSRISEVQSTVNQTNGQLSVILDQRVFPKINQKLTKLAQNQEEQKALIAKFNDKNKLIFKDLSQQMNELPKQISNQVNKDIAICKIPQDVDSCQKEINENPMEEKTFDFSIDTSALLKSVIAFLTLNTVAEILVLGSVGGVVYVYSTQIYLTSNNGWVRLTARFVRKIVSFSYPFALLFMVSNITYNAFHGLPLLQKLFIPTAKSGKLMTGYGGFVSLRITNFVFSGVALWGLFQILISFKNQPFFQLKFLLSALFSNWLYNHYSNWARGNENSPFFQKLVQLQQLEKEDRFFSLFSIVLKDFGDSVLGICQFLANKVLINGLQKACESWTFDSLVHFDLEENISGCVTDSLIDVEFVVIKENE